MLCMPPPRGSTTRPEVLSARVECAVYVTSNTSTRSGRAVSAAFAAVLTNSSAAAAASARRIVLFLHERVADERRRQVRVLGDVLIGAGLMPRARAEIVA